MTSTYKKLLERHVDYETGHTLRVDRITGDIVVRRKLVQAGDPRADYSAWAAERRADIYLPEHHRAAVIGSAAFIARRKPNDGSSSRSIRATTPESKRGRPKMAYENAVVGYMYLLVIPEPLPWVGDIIHGSIITGAGVSSGRINVKARAVIGALFLTTITAEACWINGVCERTAQRIAKAARHATHGIKSYIERRPDLRAELDARVADGAAFW